MLVPLSNPPPLTGVSTASKSLTSSSSSLAAVACPTMIRSSSYGWISAAPVSACTRAAVSARADTLGSQKVIFPPYASTARHFTAGAFFGITIHAGMPLHPAAHATAAAWLPLEGATTPCAASASLSEKIALVAPRILNDPVFCRLSHLKYSSAPAIAFNDALVSTGVRWIRGAIRSCAATITFQFTLILFRLTSESWALRPCSRHAKSLAYWYSQSQSLTAPPTFRP